MGGATEGPDMWFEDRFIYDPEKNGVGKSPGEDVWLRTTDGVRIHGWFVSHPRASAAILWLHGNAGNVEHRRAALEELRRLPADVLLVDYRGYGRSEGVPSEAGLVADARAGYDWLAERFHPSGIVVLGESLGGGPACELALAREVGGVVLQSTFTSIRDMVPHVLPIVPRRLVRTRFDNLAKVPRITAPKLFVHSRDDRVVPFEMGERLAAAAAAPKRTEWFERAGHNGFWASEPVRYRACLRGFLEEVAARAG